MTDRLIEITEPAQEYLCDLLAKQDCEGIAIRVFVLDGGTPKAETCLAFCRPGEEQPDDLIHEYEGFRAYIEKQSEQYLEDSVVDFQKDSMGGQLTIKAPNSRMPQIHEDSPLEDRVNYILFNQINPGLASHGGVVSLESLTEDNVAVLRFGGGCQGCGMVDATLKHGVEKTLMEQLPQLSAVHDVTDHTMRENAYFK